MNERLLNTFRTGLSEFLPQVVVEPIAKFFAENTIFLKITQSRTSKLGDYAFPQEHNNFCHKITINNDLDQYSFLWVLLHEMAHYQTFMKFGKNVQSHGTEWQDFYAKLIMTYKDAFPADIQELVAEFAHTLPLKKSLDKELMERFKTYVPGYVAEEHIMVKDLKINDIFVLRGYTFQILEKRRTNYKCQRLDDKKLYIVSGNAEVKVVGEEGESCYL